MNIHDKYEKASVSLHRPSGTRGNIMDLIINLGQTTGEY